MTFGRGGTGGLINRVTKAAGWDAVRELRLEAGTYDHYRGSVDLGGPLSDALALRVTGVYQNSGSWRDGVGYERWGINPTASLRIGPDTLIQLGYEHFRDERTADRGVPSAARPAGFTGVLGRWRRAGRILRRPEAQPELHHTDAANLYLSHDFGGGVTLRNRTRYAEYEKFYQNVFPGLVNAASLTNPAGLPAGSYAPGTIVQIQAYNNLMTRENLINQTDLNARFSTGAIAHTLLVGAEFGRQKTSNVRSEGFFRFRNAMASDHLRDGPPTRIDRTDQVGARSRAAAQSGHARYRRGYIRTRSSSRAFEIVLACYEHLVRG